MARLLTRAELARLAGVSAMAVTKRCAKELAPACEGKRVDVDHPSVVVWLKSKDRAPPSPAEAATNRSAAPTAERRSGASKGGRPRRLPVHDDDEDEVERFLDMTLREIVDHYGTLTKFKDWLFARKTIADIVDKELKNNEARGLLISRELVQTHIFGAMENAFKRLVTDTPKAMARRIHGAVKSGQSVEESERVIREMVSSQLRPMKAQAARKLRDAAAE
jgi:hypothetical protein